MKQVLTIIICLFSFCGYSQKQDYIWYFGDSAGINFNYNPPKVLTDGTTNSMESSSGICSKEGNLLFYISSTNLIFSDRVYIWNKKHQIMQNGDSLFGDNSITMGPIIIQWNTDSSKYYIFQIRIGPKSQFVYSIVDMSIDSGLGGVIVKNKNLVNGIFSEKITAVRHANGKDWWLIIHDKASTFYKFLIKEDSIMGPYHQAIGRNYDYPVSGADGVAGQMKISPDGKKIVSVNELGMIDLFDFDRCNGQLSNWTDLTKVIVDTIWPYNQSFRYYGCAFSPNNKLLYVTTMNETPNDSIHPDTLFQFNLTAQDIKGSRKDIWHIPIKKRLVAPNHPFVLGSMLLGPNNKIYVANAVDGYPNTIYDTSNMYIGVINQPDSIGSVCDYKPYSFYLGGKRSMVGLPNIPNYNLGKAPPCCITTIDTTINERDSILLQGAYQKQFGIYYDTLQSHWFCDSVIATNLKVAVGILELTKNKFSVYPNPATNNIVVEYSIDNNPTNFVITNILGEMIKCVMIQTPAENGKAIIDISDLSRGIYMYNVVSGNKKLKSDKLIIIR